MTGTAERVLEGAGHSLALEPRQVARWTDERDYWMTVGTMIGSTLVRWQGYEWAEYNMHSAKRAEPTRVTPDIVRMMNRLLTHVENLAAKKGDAFGPTLIAKLRVIVHEPSNGS